MSSEKRAGVPGQLAKEVAEFGLNSIIYVLLHSFRKTLLLPLNYRIYELRTVKTRKVTGKA